MNETAAHPAPAAPLGRIEIGLKLFLSAVLALLCLAVYLPALTAEFVFDDHVLIEGNRTVASLGAAFGAFFEPLWAFDPQGEIDNAFWRPLTVLSIASVRALFGLDPAAFHAFSLLLHLAATWAAWRLATRLTRCPTLGWIAAALFAVHPAHVESVAWSAALNDPLFALFALLSLERYFAWRERGPRGVPWAAGVLLFVGLLAKEQALVVPIIAFVIDVAFRHLRTRGEGAGEELARAYAPWAVAGLVYYVGRVIAYDGALLAGFDQASAGFELELARSLQLRVEILGGFLEGLLLPMDGRLFRQVRPELPEGHVPWVKAVVFSSGWLVATVLAAWQGRRLALAMLLAMPASFVLLLVNYEAAGAFPISDRFLYLPVVFAAVLVVGLLARFLPHRVVYGVGALLVLVAGWRAHARVGLFEDDMTFYRAAAEAEPDNMRALVYLGNELLERYHETLDKELLDEATFHFLTALMLGFDYGENSPKLGEEAAFIQRAKELDRLVNNVPVTALKDDPTVFVSGVDRLNANLGLGLCALGLGNLPPEYDLAWPRDIFDQIVTAFPDCPEAYDGLGKTLYYLGDFEGSEKALRTALQKRRDYPEAWHNLGLVLVDDRRYDEARSCFDEALRYRPGHLEDLVNAATCALEVERWAIAERYIERIERDHPASVDPLYLRGLLLARRGDLAGAVQRFDAVLARREQHPLAHLQRGKALFGLGNRDDAIRAFRRCAELWPDGFEAHYNLASILYANAEDPRDALPYVERAYHLSPPSQVRAELHRLLLAVFSGANDVERMIAYANMDQGRRDYVHALSWTETALAGADTWRLEPGGKSNLLYLTHLQGQLYEGLAPGAAADQRGRMLLQARDCYLAVLRIEPEHFFALHDVALLLAYKLGRPDLAKEHAQRALDMFDRVASQIPADLRQALWAQMNKIAQYEPQAGPPLAPDDG